MRNTLYARAPKFLRHWIGKYFVVVVTVWDLKFKRREAARSLSSFAFGKNNGIQLRERLPELLHSVRLQRLREGEYYLVIPRTVDFAQSRMTRVCAIDPGVRNFVTVYDPDGRTFSVSDARSAIEYRFKCVDALKSKLSALVEKKILQASAVTNTTAETTIRTEPLLRRQRYRLRRKIWFTLRRITRMIRDMHHKVSSWLSANYHEVLLPAFQTSEMARKYKQSAATDAAATVQPARARRKLSSPSVRAMMALSYFRFKNLLKYKMERSGGRVIECSEEYTSKTCSRCGNVKYDFGASAIYECHSCRLTQDRDINASKNIFMKSVSLLLR